MLWFALPMLWWSWMRPCLCRLFRWRQTAAPPRRTGYRITPASSPLHHRAKPAWVRDEVIALAARSGLSCRQVAAIFNRRHLADGMCVGKTFVDDLLRAHTADIRLQRERLKRRTYLPGPRNVVWGMDGTGKTDEKGQLHFLLGILDHGTRRCLALQALKDKASVTLLRALCDAIECCGKPHAIRTDNEAVFNSRLFCFALALLGIGKQTTEWHCPWQNGRIERFFGTLKEQLNRWAVADGDALNASLAVFRGWYNHVRPHQHLQWRTPMEAWHKTDLRRPPKRQLWFEAWDGLLQGEYLQR